MSKELFSSTDTDGSGAIDQEELSAALASKSGNGQRPDAAELFSALDSDGDGLVTEEEHESGLAAMHKDLARASMLTSIGMNNSSLSDAVFGETDADGDGSISAEELAAAVTARNEATGGSVDATELFSALDTNGDGLISAEEHAAGPGAMAGGAGQGMAGAGHRPPPPGGQQEVFDSADSNEDGVIDASELAAVVSEQNEATGAEVSASELLEALDADGDGVLSATEFAQARPGSEASGAVSGGESRQSLQELMATAGYQMYRMMGADSIMNLPVKGFSATA